MGRHGFTIFLEHHSMMKQTDRRRVFKKNREVLNGDEVFKEDGDYFYGN